MPITTSKKLFSIALLACIASCSGTHNFLERHYYYNENRRDVSGNRYDLYQDSHLGYVSPKTKKPVRYTE